MIIPGARRTLSDGKIDIPSWVLAPLSVNNGCRLHGAFEKQKGRLPSREIILTAIPDTYWPDLWRLEIETRDTPGNLFYLMNLLNSLKIEVVAAEGSANSFGRRHTMSFIISCSEYENVKDRDSEWRIATDNARLTGLADLLMLNFLDQVTFSDSGFPKVKLRRMNTYRRLHLDRAAGRRQIAASLAVENNVITLPQQLVRSLPKEDTYYTIAVDTKERCARVMIFSEASEPPGHAQFYVTRNHTLVMERLFHILVDRDCNILRFQLRLGDNKLSSVNPIAHGEGAPSRLDITYQHLDSSGEGGSILKMLIEKVNSDPILLESGVRFLKSNAEQMGSVL